MSETVNLRTPCKTCGERDGYMSLSNGQRVVRCLSCNTYAYCQPRKEAGLASESTRSSPVKPKARARILARHGHQCIGCGRSPAVHGVVLDLDHMLPVEAARRHNLYDEIIESEANLVPLCAECNRGKQDDIDAVSAALIFRVLRLKASPA